MKVGSLFSGIGGIDLGLERAGMTITWQVEKDEWCRKILTKHWPEVPKYDDVQTLQPETLEPVDLLAGGFPCQDLSVAGKRAGIIEGARSGLWREFARLIRALRPRYVLVENVPGLLIQPGLGIVLGDLACCGYDVEWESLRACCVGAPMRRERVFMVAQHQRERMEGSCFTPLQRFSAFSWNENVRRTEDLPSRSTIPRPLLRRTFNGLPRQMDRLRGLGNAVVPQIVTWIGKQIMEGEHSCHDHAH